MPELSEPPADADLKSWWIANRDRFWSVPMLICDGKSYTTYRMVNGRLPREGKPDLRVKTEITNPVSGRPDDPKGHWYPQRCRRTTTSSEVTQIRDYYVDFDVDLADELFDRDSIGEFEN